MFGVETCHAEAPLRLSLQLIIEILSPLNEWDKKLNNHWFESSLPSHLPFLNKNNILYLKIKR